MQANRSADTCLFRTKCFEITPFLYAIKHLPVFLSHRLQVFSNHHSKLKPTMWTSFNTFAHWGGQAGDRDNLQELVLFSHHMDSRDGTQVRTSGKHFLLLSWTWSQPSNSLFLRKERLWILGVMFLCDLDKSLCISKFFSPKLCFPVEEKQKEKKKQRK